MMKLLNFLEREGGIDISFGGCFHSKKKKNMRPMLPDLVVFGVPFG